MALPPTGLTALFTVTRSRPLSKKRWGIWKAILWVNGYVIFDFFPINF